MMRGFRFTSLAALVLPAALLAGCGTTTIDSGKAEALVKQSITQAGNTPGAVSCPSGIEAKAGGTVNCTFTATLKDGRAVQGTVTLHIQDANGRVTANNSDFHVTGGAAPATTPGTTTT